MSNPTKVKDNQLRDDYTELQLKYGQFLANPPNGDEVCITGISGAFPNARNIDEVRHKLYNKIDMVSDDTRKWSIEHPELPRRGGRAYDVDLFDLGYFGVHYKHAQSMDPTCRMFLERTIEAILDAGVHPKDLEGTNTGVFVGSCFMESGQSWTEENLYKQYSALTGIERSMIAHRVSYYLKLKGPSFSLDTACSSSLYSLEHAYKAIRNGECDMAIVGGTNICLHPYITIQFARLGVLSKDGMCKPFDIDGDGYVRADAVAAIFLQKAKDSNRIYSTIIHAKTNCDGFKEEGITFPSSTAQQKLLSEFYQDCNIDPTMLSYLEAHGTGTKVGDPEEVEAIDAIFCKNRQRHLLIGSMKSNIGHAEATSGICSVAKVIIGMENELIPPNINFTKPREKLEAIQKDRLRVVVEPTPFENDHGLVGVNSFGFGGGNCHVLLRWNQKNKKNLHEDDLPRLVCVSGRSENGVIHIQNDLKNKTLDIEQVRLYHNIFSKEFSNHYYRGYSILTTSGEVSRSIKKFFGTRQPLYFIFSEFGEFWAAMIRHLNCIPQFAASIQKMHIILNAHGVNLEEMIRNCSNGSNIDVFEQILGNFALQISLCDILTLIGLEPNGYFGYGTSELVCGYYDGAITLEEATLSVLQIARIATKGHKNGENSFQQLKPELLKIVRQIITVPKTRSQRWIYENSSQLANADHFIDVLNKSRSTAQTNKNFNKHNIIVQIGCNDLKYSADCKFITFNNNSTDGFLQLLKIVGGLYELGFNSKLEYLYPEIVFPVSRGTPMISPLIKWNHSKKCFVPIFNDQEMHHDSGQQQFYFSVAHSDWKYITGHVVDGRNLFPATGYLYLVWEVLASTIFRKIHDVNVVFENCKFLRALPIAAKAVHDSLTVIVQRTTGKFEVVNGNEAIATGRIRFVDADAKEELCLPLPTEEIEQIPLQTKDIYKELRLRGYNYSGSFRQVKMCNASISKASIHWDDNWITFLDNMLQLKILQMDSRLLYVPTGIRRLSINVKAHLEYVKSFGEDANIPVYLYNDIDVIKSGCVEFRGLDAKSISRRKVLATPVLEKYEFISNNVTVELPVSVRINVQLILENVPATKVKVVELFDEACASGAPLLSPLVSDALGDLPLIRPEITILSAEPLPDITNISVENEKLVTQTDCNLVIATNILERPIVFSQCFGVIKADGFIITREPLHLEIKNSKEYTIMSVHRTTSEQLVLLRKKTNLKLRTVVINITGGHANLSWIASLQNSLKESENIIVVAQNEQINGILGLVNCLRREPNGSNVKCVFIMDPNAPQFDLNNSFYSDQLKKNCAFNIYKNGQWGTYRHFLLDQTIEVDREHCYVNIATQGDLSSLKWFAGPLTSDSVMPPESTLVHIYYTAVNFRDIMTATGRITPDAITKNRKLQEYVQGFEFAGKLANGKRVFGLGICLAMATLLENDTHLTLSVPDEWSLEDAVTVPVVYGTVLYAFFLTIQIKAGDKILIHAGTGGIGQAAITIALHYGCEVFTTVGTQEKRDYLKKRFPELKDCNIGNSRDISFEQMIYQQTKGRGVDVVLNSLAEEKLEASIRCLAKNGNFLEIGKFDMFKDNRLKLMLLEKGVNFYSIMLDFAFSTYSLKKHICKLLYENMSNGAIKPLPRVVYNENQVEEAFRFMGQGKHVGKVVIKLREEEKERLCKPSKMLMKAVPRYYCDPECVTVIIGGLGGFALELADWLILRGCKNIVLTSRIGIKNGYQNYRINIWKSYGTNVIISTRDCIKERDCEQLLKEASQHGQVEAIFNLAVVLKDALFENQTVNDFNTSLEPKANATMILDNVSRTLCPYLKKFVVFSSVSCGRGNAGQTNYGMSNSIMERICEKRKMEGYPALAIQWGAIGEVGLVADMQETDTEIEIGGTLQQRVSSCLQVLDILLNQDNPIVGSMVVAVKRGGAGGASTLTEAVANIIGIQDIKTISQHSTLAELGMDSMAAVEIKQTLERDFDVFLTPQDMRNLTFAKLLEIQEEKLDGDTNVSTDKGIDPLEMLLGAFPEEAKAKNELVKMKTNLPPNNNIPEVICFPGLDGSSKVLEPLFENLNINATCLQYPCDRDENTIETMSEYLFSLIKPMLPKEKPFYFIAYSWGALVAMEIISKLESLGYSGKLICIDGAPAMLRHWMATLFNVGSQVQFETDYLCLILGLHVSSEHIFKNKAKIESCSTFEERLKICEEILPVSTGVSKDFMKQFCISSFRRLQALDNYQPSYPKLKSEVILCKAQMSNLGNFAADYQLQQLCEHPIEIHSFESNHSTILTDMKLEHTINQQLGVLPDVVDGTEVN